MLRSADTDQIKAAHRRLVKRFHPDSGTGDPGRFLAIQEAYQLLTDPLRRSEWDRRHAPGPVSATHRAAHRPRRSGSGSWSREERAGVRRPPPGRGTPPGGRPQDAAASAGARPADREGRFSRAGSGRDPASRTYTWSAAGVPWWEDFRPRPRSREAGARAQAGVGDHARPGDDDARPEGADDARPEGADARPAGADARPAGAPTRPEGAPTSPAGAPTSPAGADARPGGDMDAYARSSGAAWSMAARRYFRRP